MDRSSLSESGHRPVTVTKILSVCEGPSETSNGSLCLALALFGKKVFKNYTLGRYEAFSCLPKTEDEKRLTVEFWTITWFRLFFLSNLIFLIWIELLMWHESVWKCIFYPLWNGFVVGAAFLLSHMTWLHVAACPVLQDRPKAIFFFAFLHILMLIFVSIPDLRPKDFGDPLHLSAKHKPLLVIYGVMAIPTIYQICWLVKQGAGLGLFNHLGTICPCLRYSGEECELSDSLWRRSEATWCLWIRQAVLPRYYNSRCGLGRRLTFVLAWKLIGNTFRHSCRCEHRKSIVRRSLSDDLPWIKVGEATWCRQILTNICAFILIQTVERLIAPTLEIRIVCCFFCHCFLR